MMNYEETLRLLTEEYREERVCVVDTNDYDLTTNPRGRNRNKSRSEWADNVVKKLFGIERETIIKKKPRESSSGEYNFSYIKFAENSSSEVLGVVSGKSSFHRMYPSDLWFYALDGKKAKVKELFSQEHLCWHTQKVIILKNKDPQNSKEAYENERMMKNKFGLLD